MTSCDISLDLSGILGMCNTCTCSDIKAVNLTSCDEYSDEIPEFLSSCDDISSAPCRTTTMKTWMFDNTCITALYLRHPFYKANKDIPQYLVMIMGNTYQGSMELLECLK